MSQDGQPVGGIVSCTNCGMKHDDCEYFTFGDLKYPICPPCQKDLQLR